MLVFGIILLVAAAACLFAAGRSQGRVHAMMAAETLSVPELEEQQQLFREVAGPGSEGRFRKVCEVVGQAHPAPVGMLTSEIAGVECVWHAHRVQRRYKYYDRDDDGDTRVSTRTETVAEQSTPHGFALLRDGRLIGVDHGGKHPDGAEQVADRFEPVSAQAGVGGWAGALGGALGALAGGDRDETIGYQYTEWVIRPGTPMYVLGEVHDATGPLVIGPPQQGKGPFIMSTRSEEQLTAAARKAQRIWAWGGAAAAVVGLVLVVLAVVL